MESARNKYTKKVIEARQLQSLSPNNPDDYICCGCDVVVIPCSYHPHNKKRPYFRPKNKHKLDCEVEVEIELIKRAKTNKVATQDGFPVSFPSKLVLKDTRSITIQNSEASSTIIKRKSSSVHGVTNEIKKKNHHYTAETIRPICRQFLNYPFDRNLTLIIPDVSGRIYQDVFWRLNEIIKYHTQQIFYAPLSWKKATDTGDFLEIYLNAGEWGQLDGSKKEGYKQRYKVKVNWKNWKKTKKDTFFSELETARLETKTADENRVANKEKHKDRGWFFFIGKQDDYERTVFHVEDKRVICFLLGEMIYPKNNF